MNLIFIVSLFTASLSFAHDHGQEAATCESFQENFAQEIKNWALGPVILSTEKGAKGSIAPIGQRLSLMLNAPDKAGLIALPDREAPAGTFAGVIPLRMAIGGKFRVSLGAKAWLDIVNVKSKASVASSAHEMHKDCGKIFKVVTFPLESGKDYVLQISNSAETKIDMMVSKVAK